MTTKLRTFRNMAELVKNKRQESQHKYSQSELSHVLGYKNGQFISNVERGLCSIPLKMLLKLCQTLEINAEEVKHAYLKDESETVDKYLGIDLKDAVVKRPRRGTQVEESREKTSVPSYSGHQEVNSSNTYRSAVGDQGYNSNSGSDD